MTVVALLLGLALTQSPAAVCGRVVDATNLPLSGVTVTSKGRDTFVVTDDEGVFSLSTTTPVEVLVVALPGFMTREVMVRPGASLVVVLDVAPDFKKWTL